MRAESEVRVAELTLELAKVSLEKERTAPLPVKRPSSRGEVEPLCVDRRQFEQREFTPLTRMLDTLRQKVKCPKCGMAGKINRDSAHKAVRYKCARLMDPRVSNRKCSKSWSVEAFRAYVEGLDMGFELGLTSVPA